ncbi:MAG TPA: Crp/Fnr family transcriptional regulator [Terriglobales bacterium]|jgi:CRP-like cAMP-binding protein|nr:Crp/Fnr family transcriptional regulator [Terriglobales bacterium]
MALQELVPQVRAVTPIPAVLPARTDRDGKAVLNTVLLSIPEHEFSLLRPSLEPVPLPRYQILYDQSGTIEYAHFLNNGMISLVVITGDGRSVEVGICGRQELVGASLTFGVTYAAMRAIVQLPGNGLRISSGVLADKIDSCPGLRRMAERLLLTQQLQVAQLAACNRLHEVDQRLARWLLMCQDTVDSVRLPLTHEFIAQMLGTGRPTVTIAAGVLERAGLIENTRGAVQITNRKRLEDAACECYGAIQTLRSGLVMQ